MVDWSASMQQSFEYYIVDPGTWKDTERIRTVKSCSITRDTSAETLGSASIDMTESVENAIFEHISLQFKMVLKISIHWEHS